VSDSSPREFHPASMIFPLMDDDALDALADDIRRNGLLEPIVLDKDGLIVDGRNRQTACLMAGVKPQYKTLPGNISPTTYVIAENLTRRHLTKSQAAMAATEAEKLFADEAKERQRQHGNTAPGKPKNTSGNISLSDDQGQSRDKAGDLFGVNERYVSDAKKIAEQAPEVAEQVKAGKLTLQDAKKEVRQQQQQKQAKERPWPKRERELQRKAKSGSAVVVNIDKDHHIVTWARQQGLLVMVDRSSPWGNPFVLGDDGNRDDVCDKYAAHYLPYKVKLQSTLASLKGKVLACHCAPQRCHADAIAEAVNAS